MDELEQLKAELRLQSSRVQGLEADLEQAEQALLTADDMFRTLNEALDFWRDAAIAYRDRAERAEAELEWGWVDAQTYEWNRAMVRFFLPTRPGMND
jgi:hypothetical protein